MPAGVQLGERFVPHAELMEKARRASTGFDALNIRAGDTVAMMLRNDIAYLEAAFGVRNLGAYAVPINWHLKGEEVRYILEDSEAKALVIHADLLPSMRDHLPPGVEVFVVPTPPELAEAYGIGPAAIESPSCSHDWNEWIAQYDPWDRPVAPDTASIIYTSGTTGRPKGVRRRPSTPEQFQMSIRSTAKILGVEPGIRAIIPAPMYHSAPNAYAIYSVILEAFLVIMPRFDAEELLRLIEKHRITRLQMVPVMFVRLLKLPKEVREKYDLSSLEYIIHAAAPCAPEIKKAMIDWWGPIIHEYYGSTEMSAVTFCTPHDALTHPGTVGKPVPDATVRVLDERGNEAPPGCPGTIYGKLNWIADFTYQGDPAKRQSIEKDGLITSGDIGYFDEDGYLYLCDRANDMVISGGVNIYPAEIEGVLVQMPGVRDCAVFGIPDEEFGESLAAVIEPQDGAQLTADAVRAYLRERIADYKVPKVVEFRVDLPREDSGKLFKRKLRAPYWEKAGRQI